MKKSVFYMLLLMTVVLSSCGSASKNGATLIVSIEPLRYFAEQIVGNRMQVETLVPAGSSPETYEPTPHQMVALADSRAFISVGTLGFEQSWMPRIHENAPSLPVFCASDSIDFILDANGVPDPHTWTSPRTACVMATNIYHAVCSIDSVNAGYYKRNYETLIRRLTKLDADIHKMLAEVTNRTFIIYHPALTYFAHDYGLFQIVIEEEGKEPTPESIHNVIVRGKGDDVKVVFVQREFNQRNASIVSKSIGAPMVTINPLSYDFCNEMMDIAKKLKAGK
ncbi:MAG: zinc ABC transporter substrate-binding protein [Bacteroidaceae bacterium]|nr:zinc ABC transporter substrate-binding protein [Bacteroidaceae bacterium]